MQASTTNKAIRTIEINLNGLVLVQLTSYGRNVLKAMYCSVPKADKDGWTQWRFNELWATFASHRRFGHDCFNSTVQFVVNKPIRKKKARA